MLPSSVLSPPHPPLEPPHQGSPIVAESHHCGTESHEAGFQIKLKKTIMEGQTNAWHFEVFFQGKLG